MYATRNRVAGTLLVLGAAFLAPTPLASPAQAAEVHLGARMLDTVACPNARGGASYDGEHGRREFEIHIRGVRALHGKLLTVRVHGTFVGRMRVGTYGRAHLERHSGVPRMAAGDTMRVRTPAGRLVTHGTFHRAVHR